MQVECMKLRREIHTLLKNPPPLLVTALCHPDGMIGTELPRLLAFPTRAGDVHFLQETARERLGGCSRADEEILTILQDIKALIELSRYEEGDRTDVISSAVKAAEMAWVMLCEYPERDIGDNH